MTVLTVMPKLIFLPNAECNMLIDPFGSMTPVDRNQLIQIYAAYRYSSLYRAPQKAQDTAERKWKALQSELRIKYPALDLNKPQIQQELERRADSWWSNKAVKGEGVDW